jgi:hypothetical protein
VARVRLRIDDFDTPETPLFHLFDPRSGLTQRLPVLRLATTVLIGPNSETVAHDLRPELDAIVDTGAWVSVVKKGAWLELEEQGLVEHLERRAADGTVIDGMTNIGGRRLAFTFGRIWMAVVERSIPLPGVMARRPNRLPAVPVLCQLLQEDEKVLKRPILLGLHRGVFDGRQLRRVPVPVQTTPHDRIDVGPRFGQQWWLQDE